MPERTEDSQIAKILADVYERDGEGGARALEAAIGEHPDLADELRAHAEMLELVTEAFDDPEKSRAHLPDEIGGYQISEIIGRGGMATVYRARQRRPLRREVAVKVLHQRITDLPALARFDLERESLALMDHANIARILDAGVASDGTPYVVVELVEGVPITEYCATNNLGLGARLRLMTTVCDALQHAHQKGVIHRDIKPSNVLVTEVEGKPVAKVIDFGLAKAIGDASGDPSLTVVGQVLGTPAYMSPEQASAGEVDTRTDVYGLGMLLYELLVGDVAWDRASCSRENFVQFVQRLAKEDPPRPSQRHSTLHGEAASDVTPRGWERRLRGELDWITLKALAKERGRRYPTPQALGADIHRYLDHEPVEAGPPSTTYRMRKFVRRHRASVLAAAGIAVALCAGLVVSLLLHASAKRSEAREAEARKEAEDLANFMVLDLHDRLRDVARLDLLEDVAVRALAYTKSRVAPRGPAGAKQRAMVLFRIALTLHEGGRLDLAQGACEGALEAIEVALRAAPGDVEAKARAGQAHDELGAIAAAQGRTEEAVSHYHTSIQLIEASLHAHPTPALLQRQIGLTYHRLGQLACRAGRLDETLELLRKRLVILKALPAPTDDVWTQIGEALSSMSDVFKARGRVKEAREFLDEALAHVEPIAADDPGSLAAREILGRILIKRSNLTVPYDMRDAKRAVRIFEQLHEEDPDRTRWRMWEGEARVHLAYAYLPGHHAREAQQQARLAIDLLSALCDQEPKVVTYWNRLARAHKAAAHASKELGRMPDALQHCESALTAYAQEELLGGAEPSARESVALIHVERAAIQRTQGKFDEAERAGRSALQALTAAQADGVSPRKLAKSLMHAKLELARALVAGGDLAGATQVAESSLPLVPAESDSQWVALAVEMRRLLWFTTFHSGDFADGLRHVRAMLALVERQVAGGLEREDDLRAAREGIRLGELLTRTRTPEGPQDHLFLAYALRGRGEYVRAAAHFQEAVTDRSTRSDLGRGHLYNAACAAALASAGLTTDESTRLREQAVAWLAEDRRLRREAIEAYRKLTPPPTDLAQREALYAQMLEHARAKDPDLAPLRALPEFRKLFEEQQQPANEPAGDR